MPRNVSRLKNSIKHGEAWTNLRLQKKKRWERKVATRMHAHKECEQVTRSAQDERGRKNGEGRQLAETGHRKGEPNLLAEESPSL